MIRIDGSQGEGGGQVLRSALTLSVLTGQPFEIVNIRAGRSRPGLLRQHLTALRAAAAVCGGGHSDAATLGSTKLSFHPGDVRAGNFEFAVGTAGSATLVSQTILLPLLRAGAGSRVLVSGGTHNPAAPPYGFLETSYLPLLTAMGGSVAAKLLNFGFMPAGGGRIMLEVAGDDTLTPIALTTRGAVREIVAEAIFANFPYDIAARELDEVGRLLSLPASALRVREVKSSGPGNVLMLTVRSENVTEVFTAFAERGVPAEEVAGRVAAEVQTYLAAEVAVGPYLADQLLLPLAIAGGGEFTTVEPTLHTLTNASIIKAFLPVAIHFQPIGDSGNVTVRVENQE